MQAILTYIGLCLLFRSSKNRSKCLLSQLRKLLCDLSIILKIKNAFKIVFHHLMSSKKYLTMCARWFCIVTRAFLPVLGGAILQNLLNFIHHYLSWWQISWHGVWNRWSFFCSELLKVSRTLFSLHSSLPSQQSQIPSFTLLLIIQVGEDLKKIIFIFWGQSSTSSKTLTVILC